MKSPVLRRNNGRVLVTRDQVTRHKLDLLPPESLSRFAGDTWVVEDWLEMPIGDGWVAAYRLAHSGRPSDPRTRILEVRVFPDERDRKSAGEWSATLLGSRAKAAKQFTFEGLRRGLTEKSFNAALQATRANAEQHGALKAFGYPGTGHRSDHEGRGAGRPGLQRTFYALVAVRYDQIEHDFRRDPGTSTRELLKKRYYPKATLAAIGKWLATARKQGFLTPVSRGQRGSRATDVARQLAKKAG